MNLQLSRKETIFLIEGLNARIKTVENLISLFTLESLIDAYTKEKEDLIELKQKLTLSVNIEYNILSNKSENTPSL
jgi:hypothetical protein